MSNHFRSVKPRFWVLMFTVIGLACTAAYLSQQRYIDRQQARIAELQAQISAAVQINAELQHDIDFTYTDEYIEREARSKLGLIKEGEILFESND